MAAVELKRLVALTVRSGAIPGIEHFASKRLDCGSGQYLCEFGEMSASVDAGQSLPDTVAKAFHQVQPDQLSIGWRNRIAITRIRYGIRRGVDRLNRQLCIDG